MFVLMAYDLPSCEDCKSKVYEGHKTGKAKLKTSNSGRTFDRLPNMPPPCHECPKVAAKDRLGIDEYGRPSPVTSAKAAEATERQCQALHYYRMMKFDRDGRLPYDKLTLQNNVLIAQAEEEARAVNSAPSMVFLGK